MIPKKIHYCWFGGQPLNKLGQKCLESWKKHFPDYEIIEWNESNFDINCCDYVREAYEAKRWAFVSDYARFKILYEHGGIYFDTDQEAKSFSNSPELDAYLESVKEDIKSGKTLRDTSFLYNAVDKDAYKNPKRYDRYAFARKISVVNPNVDEDGYFTCDLVDYSDFKDENVDSIGTYLNKWGYKMQEKGKYKPHYQIVKIRRRIR